MMFSTEGIDAVASVTDLRSRTTEIVDQARRAHKGILIQRNSKPLAVLVSYEWYQRLVSAAETVLDGSDDQSAHQ